MLFQRREVSNSKAKIGSIWNQGRLIGSAILWPSGTIYLDIDALPAGIEVLDALNEDKPVNITIKMTGEEPDELV